LLPFQPLFRSAHLLTISANYWNRVLDISRFPVRTILHETEPGVRVLVQVQDPRVDSGRHLVIVHGLEGSGESGYARSLAQKALENDVVVHRFHMRSCGGTEAHSGAVLYHSGQTGDLLAVLRQIRRGSPHARIHLAGFSLGGNVVLKLAGELKADAPDLIDSVTAVSVPIDLAACARRLRAPENRLYANRFLKRLKNRVRTKEKLHPGIFRMDLLDRVRTIEEFDDAFTAPCFGFGTAANYYATQSACGFLDHIRVPTLVVQAMDDPLVPFSIFDHPAFRTNPDLRLLAVEHGGHLGFLASRRPRFWLDRVIIEWIRETEERAAGARSGGMVSSS
jgi:predicted alpha/beta-fold hydrolase